MKHLLVILSLLIGSSFAFAQTQKVQRVEFEFSTGLSMPLGGYKDGKTVASTSLGLDLRYNMKESPLDYGISIRLGCAVRDFPTKSSVNMRTTSALASVSYNFRQGHKVNPFISLGMGIGQNDVPGDMRWGDEKSSAVFVPKVGVELLHHIRFNALMQLSRKGYHNYGLTIGFVIGGRPKK